MSAHVSPIMGVMFGFELFEDEGTSYIVIDLFIMRIMLVREKE